MHETNPTGLMALLLTCMLSYSFYFLSEQSNGSNATADGDICRCVVVRKVKKDWMLFASYHLFVLLFPLVILYTFIFIY